VSLVLLFGGPLDIPEGPPPPSGVPCAGVSATVADGVATITLVVDLTQIIGGVGDPFGPSGRLQ
jgi:hypothetical protein